MRATLKAWSDAGQVPESQAEESPQGFFQQTTKGA
jgi:hypothetical protein